MNSTIYWNDNSGSKIEAKMAEIEARLVGMIQVPTRKFTKFRTKNVHHFMQNLHNFLVNCLKVELFYAFGELEKVVFQKK
jgi:hypothetical protein